MRASLLLLGAPQSSPDPRRLAPPTRPWPLLAQSLCQLAHPGSLLLALAGLTNKASRCPKVSTAACTFEPFLRFAPTQRRPESHSPGLSVECKVRESSMAGVGSEVLPSSERRKRSTRRSWTISSKTPASSHLSPLKTSRRRSWLR